MKSYSLILLLLVFLSFGCRYDNASYKVDEETYFENLHSAPLGIVQKESLPEWLQTKIEYNWEHYVVNPIHKSWLEIFRGEWNKRTVYHFWHVLSSNSAEIYYDDGTKPSFETTDIPDIKWVLIYQIFDGVVTEPDTKSIARKSIGDKYEFPDISGLNDW